MKNKLVSGSFWLSTANILCKILGIVYLIPWLAMMGSFQDKQQAQALYSVAYLPYALFLTLGTSGFPTGLAKKIANNIKDNKEDENEYVFSSSLTILNTVGLISAILLFILAPALSRISPTANQYAATIAIRSLCPSLLIIPFLSALRGYFQGKSLIKEFGISMVIEQVARIIVILLGTYLLRIIFKQSVLSAVVISTFASCIGGIFSIIYLIYKGLKEKLFKVKTLFSFSISNLKEEKTMIKEVIHESLPFIYVGSLIPLSQLIDQVTIKYIFLRLTDLNLNQIENVYTLASANPIKLTAVLLAITGSITVTALPLIASSVGEKQISETISKILTLSYNVIFPATIGMILVSMPLNTMFFYYSLDGSYYLILNTFSTFVVSVFSIVLLIVQALGYHKYAMKATTIMLVLKFILQFPAIYIFQGYGIVLASIASYGIMAILSLRFIFNKTKFRNAQELASSIFNSTEATLAMSIICTVMLIISNVYTNVESKGQSFITICIVGITGIIFYAYFLSPKKFKEAVKKFIKK
ncbi:hypothetical protein BG261_02240 [Floricoccus tropicus]|uniref:Uncharacterized protein n=1 Tax=Floricoccus tropicus TaxID=1859473 RepID=A0A1E8GMD9_9LACT|nr:polysaccharide biosynthesis protein [Floricoccus tropicus]OFI49419.1 hypothetical protein BG261_02240 [Floricoccus tropicus]